MMSLFYSLISGYFYFMGTVIGSYFYYYFTGIWYRSLLLVIIISISYEAVIP